MKIRIAAMVASLAMAIPVFAQYTTTSAQSQDTAKAHMIAAEMLNDPNVHWTVKEQAALLVQSPYVRPSDMWEISHMFRTMSANDQRVVYQAVTNAIKANVGDYYTRRAAERAYYYNMYNNPSLVTTTVTSTPSGSTSVTTTTTPVAGTPPVVVTTPPAITTPSTDYTPSTVVEIGARPQTIVGVMEASMSTVAAWELMQKDLDASDRTTFRMLFDNMTSSQQDALINIVKGSHYYYVTRSAGVYYNPY